MSGVLSLVYILRHEQFPKASELCGLPQNGYSQTRDGKKT